MPRYSIALVPLLAALAHGGELLRGPYLQSPAPESVVVRWNTQDANVGVLRYGASPDALDHVDQESKPGTAHRLRIHGVAPGSKVYYSIGTPGDTLAGGDAKHYVVLPPVESKPARFLVLGDAGTGGAGAKRVRDALIEFMGKHRPGFWLLLGDNAYEGGAGLGYQQTLFDMYPTLLRNCALWPTIGNHDADAAQSSSQTGPYFAIFDLPKDGESGGIPSQTEAYGSFDHGDLHVIYLDSAEVGGNKVAMREWLKQDLAQSAKPWTIAYWHHSPYTKGKHDSDAESELIRMREVYVPVLEQGGVDLVLTAHSHGYERSMLIDGHYGSSGSFDPNRMALDSGNGRVDGDGAYLKPTLPKAQHEGTVYVVCGVSAAPEGPSGQHPVMLKHAIIAGGLVIDVHGAQLDCRFVDGAGRVRDRFTVVKGGAVPIQWNYEPVGAKSAWSYHDGGLDLGDAWTMPGFDDSGWKEGAAGFGFGSAGVETVIAYGPKPQAKYVTTYFRKHFTVAEDVASVVESMRASVRSTAGFVLHLNGAEILRHDLPSGAIGSSTLANAKDDDEFHGYDLSDFRRLLVAGENVLAAEVHLPSLNAKSFVFDAVLGFDAFPDPRSEMAMPPSEAPVLRGRAKSGCIEFTLDAPGGVAAVLVLRAEGSEELFVPVALEHGRGRLAVTSDVALSAEAVVVDASGRKRASAPWTIDG